MRVEFDRQLDRLVRGFAAPCVAGVIAVAALAFPVTCLAQAPTAPATPPPPAPAAPAAPAAAAPAGPPKVQYTGLFDFYYLDDFHNPKNLPSNDIGVPAYDSRNSTPTLSLAELNIALAPPANGGFGFKTTLMTGDTADINHSDFPESTSPQEDEARYKNLQQLYVMLVGKSGWGGDLGEFYTPFGYEVTESNANYNYSRSLVYQFMEPVYHTGVRLYTPSLGGFVGTLYVVNALNNTPREGLNDDNNQKGFIFQGNMTDPKGRYSLVETIGNSQDQNVAPFGGITLPTASNYYDKTTLSDTDFTYNIKTWNLGLNYAYRKDQLQGAPDVTANGYAAYIHDQFTPKYAWALRYSGIDPTQSGNKVGETKPYEFTGTLEEKFTGSLLGRLEYRHDAANQEVYLDSSGNPTEKSQDTVSISAVYTFGP